MTTWTAQLEITLYASYLLSILSRKSGEKGTSNFPKIPLFLLTLLIFTLFYYKFLQLHAKKFDCLFLIFFVSWFALFHIWLTVSFSPFGEWIIDETQVSFDKFSTHFDAFNCISFWYTVVSMCEGGFVLRLMVNCCFICTFS